MWRTPIRLAVLIATVLLSSLGLSSLAHAQIEPEVGEVSSPMPSSTQGPRPSDSSDENRGYQRSPGDDPDNRLISSFAKHLANDQKQFWMTPRHLHVKDLKWAAPAAATMAAVVASDSWIEKQIPSGGAPRSQKVSDFAAYSLVGVGAGSFLLGRMRRNDHLAEAGLLSGEAAISSTSTSYFFKTAFGRQRPYEGTQHGAFFRGGTSFPSEHAAVAWSVASVWAHEYPGFLSRTLAYGLASAVTITRVTGKQHFASDALIGSALGWYFGRQAYRAHHDSDLSGAAWGGVFDDVVPSETTPNPRHMGSPYVPMDSWVYAALDRLVALGFITDAYLAIRPWTRLECARMLEEAEERSNLGAGSAELDKTFSTLAEEFGNEAKRLDGDRHIVASLDSLYLRTTSISGTPLRDGFHFGQTIVNDYGRPYAEGFSTIAGITAHGQAGPLSFSVQGEYQHAPLPAGIVLPSFKSSRQPQYPFCLPRLEPTGYRPPPRCGLWD